jgi:16S rRNA (cytidine1402-2'-O)-methyltransferase
VATPIGNLGDTTHRAVEVLRDVDAIASEDTRRTRKLLSHYGIKTSLVAYHEHNEERAARAVIERINQGQSIALVTDAGTPLISDPGYRLVEQAVGEGIDVVCVPGPSAVVAALSVAGLPPMPFHFLGFLPRKSAARRTKLASFADLPGTLVFYVSPHRVEPVLRDMLEVLGEERRAVLARELTKVHEELLRGTLADLSETAGSRALKGEIVVLVEGSGSKGR